MVIPEKLTSNLQDNIRLFEGILPLNKSFDIITREISLGFTSCFFIGLNGMCDLQIIQWLFADNECNGYGKDLFPSYSHSRDCHVPHCAVSVGILQSYFY